MPEQSYRPVLTPTPAATAPIQPVPSHPYDEDWTGLAATNPTLARWGREEPSAIESAVERAARRIYRFLGGGGEIGAGPVAGENFLLPGTVSKAAQAVEPAIAAELRSMVGEAVAAVKQKIRAYHGSPHDFDQFSMEKIGTGEGAQAYGHGLYFAENENVARDYRNALARIDVNQTADGQPVSLELQRRIGDAWSELQNRMHTKPQISDVLDVVHDDIMRERAVAMQSRDAEAFNRIDDLRAEAWRVRQNPPTPQGRMYEVEINASPDELLDWDKPLSQQSRKIQNIANEAIAADVNMVPHDRWVKLPAETRRRYMVEAELPENRWAYLRAKARVGETGRDLYRAMAGEAEGSPTAAAVLKRRGVPGIRYLDGGSRTAGTGTSNFVVFDDKLITILRKYGVAGAIGAGYSMQQIQAAQQPPVTR